jgi:hypothetical protein
METLNENHFQSQINVVSEGNPQPLYYMVIDPIGEEGYSTILYTLNSIDNIPDAFFLGYQPSETRQIPMVKLKSK